MLLKAGEPVERTISVTYTCYLTGFPEKGKDLSIWLPVPQSDDRQTVEITSADLTLGKFTHEEKYGNKMYYHRVDISSYSPSDTLKILLTYKVRVNEKKVVEAQQLKLLPKTTPQNMGVILPVTVLFLWKEPLPVSQNNSIYHLSQSLQQDRSMIT